MPYEYSDFDDEYMDVLDIDDIDMAEQYQQTFASYGRGRRYPYGYGRRRPYYRRHGYYYPRGFYGRRGRRFGFGFSPYGLTPFLFF